MSKRIVFDAESVIVEAAGYQLVQVTLDADMTAVVEDMDLSDRLHNLEASDVVEEMGAPKLLDAMSEPHFSEWVKAHGDFYEVLNAIGIECIHEWIADYTGGE